MGQYEELIQFLKQQGKLELLVKRRGVRVVQNYNLRWPKDAIPETHDWTVFVNRRGNLAHALLADVPEAMTRIPGLHLKNCSEEYARVELAKILERI